MKNNETKQWKRLVPALATLAFASCTTSESTDNLDVNERAQAVATAPALGASGSYGVLAGTVVNTGNSAAVVSGNVGAGVNVNGFPPGTATGTISQGAGNVAALAAALTASGALAIQACDTTAGPGNVGLAGQTFTPGVHCFTGPASISAGGTVTLDFQGDPNAVFVFRVGTAFTSQAGASIVLANTGGTVATRGCNVFWRAGTSFTLGADVTFIGNVFAGTAANLGDDTTVEGRVFSGTTSNLSNAQITAAGCQASEPDAGSEDAGEPDAGDGDGDGDGEDGGVVTPDAGPDAGGDGDHDADCSVPPPHDPCQDCPCVHGTCTVDQGAPYCVCEPGYTGTYCDQCVSEPVTQQ